MDKRAWWALTSAALILAAAAGIFLFGQLFPPEGDRGRAVKRAAQEKGRQGPAAVRLNEISAEEFFGRISGDQAAAASFNLLRPDKATFDAIDKGISWLKARPSEEIFPIADRKISAGELLSCLQRLKDALRQGSEEKIRQALTSGFRFYQLTRPEGEGSGVRGGEVMPLLITGYYQPEVRGSLVKEGPFRYPLYGVPDDLVSVRLRQFDETLPDRTLFGRVDGGRLIPYFTRHEIDLQGLLPDSLALCWLESYVDALEIQIQGSAVIDLPGGSSRFIHFAASNGRAYGSLGRWLIDKGYLKADGLDWPTIKAWAENHPDEMKEALKANPRYIFFRWEKEGPIGALGFKIVPGRSAALDPGLFPPALPLVIGFNLPKYHSYPGWLQKDPPGQEASRIALLVFNHDKGAAIRGPFRLDLYCGTGTAAGALAGRLKAKSAFYLLLPKEVWQTEGQAQEDYGRYEAGGQK